MSTLVLANSSFLAAAAILYSISLLICLGFGSRSRDKRSVRAADTARVGAAVSWISGFAAHSVALGLRGAALGTLPVTGTYEALVFYAWVFAAGYAILVRGRIGRASVVLHAGACLLPIALLVLASSPLVDASVVPVVPVLQSHWLWFHVGFVFLGEGFLFVAFVASLLQVLPPFSRRTQLAGRMDQLAYRAVAIGLPLFTLGGLLFGAIWAKHAWGRYWGWDPKETFMLVTWLVFVLYLHLRLRRNLRGRRVAWIAILGFLLALFTFAGVNYLIPGLHGYV